MQLGSLCFLFRLLLLIRQLAHEILRILYSSVNLLHFGQLCVLCEVFQMVVHQLTLQLFFLLVDLSHVFSHKLVDIDIFISGASRCRFRTFTWNTVSARLFPCAASSVRPIPNSALRSWCPSRSSGTWSVPRRSSSRVFTLNFVHLFSFLPRYLCFFLTRKNSRLQQTLAFRETRGSADFRNPADHRPCVTSRACWRWSSDWRSGDSLFWGQLFVWSFWSFSVEYSVSRARVFSWLNLLIKKSFKTLFFFF